MRWIPPNRIGASGILVQILNVGICYVILGLSTRRGRRGDASGNSGGVFIVCAKDVVSCAAEPALHVEGATIRSTGYRLD